MKKLIYADDISARLERVIRIGAKADDGEHPISAECVLSVLESLPPVDAVEVVRCKDCKYWRDTDHTCRGHSLVSPMTADDFCSYGKKDGDHEKAD